MKPTFASSYWPAAALLAYAVLQLIPWPGTGPISVDSRATAEEALAWAGLALLYVAMGELGGRVQNRWLLVAPIILFGAGEAALGLFQRFSGGPEQFATGTFAEHSHFAGLLEMALPFAVILPVGKSESKLARPLLLSVPAILVFLGLVYSYSRMGLAAAVLSLALLGIGWRVRTQQPAVLWRVVPPVAVAGLFLFVFAPSGLMDRFERIASFRGFAHDAHLARWQATGRLIAAHPVLGAGFGAYPSAFEPYNVAERHKTVRHADDDYLELLAELGIAGFGIAAAFIAGSVRRAIFAYRTAADASKRLIALASVAALGAILVHSIFEFQLHVAVNACAFMWISGLHARSIGTVSTNLADPLLPRIPKARLKAW